MPFPKYATLVPTVAAKYCDISVVQLWTWLYAHISLRCLER